MKKYFLIISMLLISSYLHSSKLEDYFIKLTSDLLGGSFISETEVILCGKSGKVIYSNDIGQNWQTLEVPTYEDINDIAKNDDDKIFLIGNNGIILWTDLKEINWNKLNLNIGTNFNSICFFDNCGVISADSGLVLLSFDFGNTWEKYSLKTEYPIMKSIVHNNIIYSFDKYSNMFAFSKQNTKWENINKEGELFPKSNLLNAKIKDSIIYILTDINITLYNLNNNKSISLPIQKKHIIDFDFAGDNELFIIFQRYLSFTYNMVDLYRININNFEQGFVEELPQFDTNYRIANASIKKIVSNANKNIHFLVGSLTTILKSNNKGHSWNYLSHNNFASNNKKIAFFNDSSFFVLKNYNIYTTSKNNGATFEPFSNADLPLANVYDIKILNENKKLFLLNMLENTEIQLKDSNNNLLKEKNIKLGNPYIVLSQDKKYFYLYGSLKNSTFLNSRIFKVDDELNYKIIKDYDSCGLYALHTERSRLIVTGKKYIRKYFYDSTKQTGRIIYNGLLSVSEDNGENWDTKIYHSLEGLTSLLTFPSNPNQILYCASFYQADSSINYYITRSVEPFSFLNYYLIPSNVVSFFRNEDGVLLAFLRNSMVLYSQDEGLNWKELIRTPMNTNQEAVVAVEYINNKYYVVTTKNVYVSRKDKITVSNIVESKINIKNTDMWVWDPFPNPTSDLLNLRLIWSKKFNFEDIRFEIYNVLGHKLRNFSIKSINYELDNKALIQFRIDNTIKGLNFIIISLGNSLYTYPIFLE